MHTEEWIARETSLDRSKTFGFSLKQEAYELPMIKLNFGKEYVPVPQNRMATLMLEGMEVKEPLKQGVYGAWCFIAADELGLAHDKVEATYGNGRVPDGTGSEEEKAIFDWIEKKIQSEGPHVVLGWAMSAGYDHLYDGMYVDKEEPYKGLVGEKQEWDMKPSIAHEEEEEEKDDDKER